MAVSMLLSTFFILPQNNHSSVHLHVYMYYNPQQQVNIFSVQTVLLASAALRYYIMYHYQSAVPLDQRMPVFTGNILPCIGRKIKAAGTVCQLKKKEDIQYICTCQFCFQSPALSPSPLLSSTVLPVSSMQTSHPDTSTQNDLSPHPLGLTLDLSLEPRTKDCSTSFRGTRTMKFSHHDSRSPLHCHFTV